MEKKEKMNKNINKNINKNTKRNTNKNTNKLFKRAINRKIFFSTTKSISKHPLVRLDRYTYQLILWIQGLLQQRYFRRYTIGQTITTIVEDYIYNKIADREITDEDIKMLEKITKEG